MRVYRVYGGESQKMGRFWSPENPRAKPNYRAGAGLPRANSGEYVAEGILKNTSGVTVSRANALEGNVGGIVQFEVPNPTLQIEVQSVEPLDVSIDPLIENPAVLRPGNIEWPDIFFFFE